MSFRTLACAWLLSLAALAGSRAMAGPAELVETERAFATAVATDGMRAGFLRFLAEDGILLRPRPVAGPAFFREQPEDPGLLEWAPAYARVAKSGDLGFTLGPWRYRASRTNDAVNATGQFVTVWRRTKAGWRAALDGGIGSPPMEFPSSVQADGPDDADEPLPSWRQTQRDRDLRVVEESFGRRAAREGEAMALEEHGHKRVWVLRSGVTPLQGRGNGVQFLAANRRKTRDAIRGLIVSGGGDLGFAWGESELLGSGPDPARPVRSWVRVWRRSGWSGTWRVALDLAIDYPEAGLGSSHGLR
jgi:ketosteroid isomerase-like protein